MAQLIWTGTDEQQKYRDDERNIIYWPSQRPVDVPEDVASEYLEHEGWQEKEDEDADLVERTIEEHDQARAEVKFQNERETVTETNDDGSVTVTNTTEDDADSVDVDSKSESKSKRTTTAEAESEAESESATAGGDQSEDAEAEAKSDGFRDGDTADDGETVPEEVVEERKEAAREPEDAEFDASRFIDGNWNSVSAAIREGVADDHLDAVEEAERDRPGGPRENSVLSAIEDRRETIDSASE